MPRILFSVLAMAFAFPLSMAQQDEWPDLEILPFGEGIFMDDGSTWQFKRDLTPETSERYLDRVFDSIEIQRDIVFGETVNFKGGKQELLRDVYTPAGDKELKRPAILWIHGGGFRYGNDKTQSFIVAMARRFAQGEQ